MFFSSFGSFGMSSTLSSATSASRLAIERLELFARQLAHVGVAAGDELLGVADVADDGRVLAEPLDHRLDLGQLFRELPEGGRVRLRLGAAEPREDLLVPPFD